MKEKYLALILFISIFMFGCAQAVEPTAQEQELSPALAETASAEIDEFVKYAKERVAAATQPAAEWDGPTTGPAAQGEKLIIYIASDLRNGGVLGVAEGVEEAGKSIGWEVRVLDGRGTNIGQKTALENALSQYPDGIVIGGFNDKDHADLIQSADDAGIKLVGWHVAADPGPIDGSPLIANISSDSQQVAEIAALFAVADSEGEGGVIIFTDSNFEVALAKSDAMAKIIEQCTKCDLFSVEDVSLAETSIQMPARITELHDRFGHDWDYSLGINDLYFDFGGPSIQIAFAGEEGPKSLSAGDGSISAYGRIRDKEGQVGTVPEPLKLHGWQIIDELNRAFAGEEWSGYVTPVHLVVPENISFDGGPENVYDPDNGYQEAYKTIWQGEGVTQNK